MPVFKRRSSEERDRTVDVTRSPDLARRRSDEAVANAEKVHEEINRELAESRDPSTRWFGTYGLGETALERDDLDKAAELFQDVADAQDPWSSPLAMLRLGEIASRRGEVADAAVWLDRATASHHPEATPRAWLALADLVEPFNAVVASEAIRNAETALRETIQWAARHDSAPTDVIGREAQLQLAELQDRQGRHQQAAEVLGRLIRANGSDAVGRRAHRLLATIDPTVGPATSRTVPWSRPPRVQLPREARPAQRLSHDAWTDVDQLDRARYADALADFLFDDETRAPLAVGIYGAWGSGKTSLMRMLRRRIDPEGAAGRAIAANGGPALSARDAIRRLRDRRGDGPRPSSLTQPGTRITVWFNAWMYQSRQEVWAGLARDLITQTARRMPRRDRELFWLELNMRRMRYDRVRTRWHRWLLERLLPSIVLAGGAILAGAVLSLAGVLQPLLGLLGGAAVGVLAGGLAAVGRLSPHLGRSSENLFKDLLDAPDYAPSAASYAAVLEDVQRAVGLVATPTEPLVVFVDDLDRCDAKTVAEVIEAINLFLGGGIENCIFVLGMDPRVIAATLVTAYGELERSDAVTRHASAPSIGWRFLDKLVQLPLRLPTVGESEVDLYVASLLSETGGTQPLRLPTVSALTPFSAQVQRAYRRDPRGAGSAAGHLESGIKILRQEQETIIEFRDDSPQTAAIIRQYAVYFGGNPREIKRFLNLFRVFASLAVRRELHGGQRDGDREPEDLEALAKLSVLCVRWPHLIDLLLRAVELRTGRSRIVLGILEDVANFEARRDLLRQWFSEEEVVSLTVLDGLPTLLDRGPRLEHIASRYL